METIWNVQLTGGIVREIEHVQQNNACRPHQTISVCDQQITSAEIGDGKIIVAIINRGPINESLLVQFYGLRSLSWTPYDGKI